MGRSILEYQHVSSVFCGLLAIAIAWLCVREDMSDLRPIGRSYYLSKTFSTCVVLEREIPESRMRRPKVHAFLLGLVGSDQRRAVVDLISDRDCGTGPDIYRVVFGDD